jgi:hypothetical protein
MSQRIAGFQCVYDGTADSAAASAESDAVNSRTKEAGKLSVSDLI